jgi:hypothetical protein
MKVGSYLPRFDSFLVASRVKLVDDRSKKFEDTDLSVSL